MSKADAVLIKLWMSPHLISYWLSVKHLWNEVSTILHIIQSVILVCGYHGVIIGWLSDKPWLLISRHAPKAWQHSGISSTDTDRTKCFEQSHIYFCHSCSSEIFWLTGYLLLPTSTLTLFFFFYPHETNACLRGDSIESVHSWSLGTKCNRAAWSPINAFPLHINSISCEACQIDLLLPLNWSMTQWAAPLKATIPNRLIYTF